MTSNRLNDYFVVIGSSMTNLIPLSLSSYSDSDSQNYSSTTFISDPLRVPYTPQILDRYPLEDHENTSFPTGLTLFCLPEGMHLTTRPKPASFFSFVQTSDTGSHLIGSCFTFYEPLNETQRKCLNLLIDQSNDMDISSSALTHVKFYLPRCLCLISQWPFVSSYKKFLCHIYRLSLTPCYIPIERYICNFIDDIPLPPSGKMEVSYFIGTEVVHFIRPPCNEPQVWSMNMSILPLFETLSYQSILSLVTAILSERQIVLVSSQYSLLTLVAEAILSFIFPLKWTHVYIPILPKQLLGVLAAPLPFLVGIHTSFLPENDVHNSGKKNNSFCNPGTKQSLSGHEINPEQDSFSASSGGQQAIFTAEIMRVYLDTNEIDFGSLGAPPSLPESRLKKLLFELSKSAPSIENRHSDWEYNQLPFYDSAFPMAARPDVVDLMRNSNSGLQCCEFDPRGVHIAFLNVFTYLLQDYRKYLIHPSHTDPTPMKKFRTSDYLQDHSSESSAILISILQSQAFYQFIEASVSNCGWSDPDILFFDESIEAHLNRSSFLSFVKLDTPFLLDESNKHAKTVVAPSPIETIDDDLLQELRNPTDALVAATQVITLDKTGKEVFRYNNFPKLNPKLFRSRPKSSLLNGITIHASPLRSVGRLKRVQSYSPKFQTPIPEACIYSTYLILFSRILSSEYSVPIIKHNPPSLAQILSRLHISRPLSVSSESGLSSHRDLILQSTQSNSLHEDIHDKQKVKLDNIETLFGDIELVSLRELSQSPVCQSEIHQCHIVDNSDDTLIDSLNQIPSSTSKGFVNYQDNVTEEAVMIARAAMEILFEIFDYMENKTLHIDEEVYRSLADACAVCSASDRVINLLESMISHGMVPDMQISIAVARTLYFSTGDISDEAADTGRSDIPLFLPVTPKEVSDAVLSKDLKRLRSSIRRKGSYHYPLFPSPTIKFSLLNPYSSSSTSTAAATAAATVPAPSSPSSSSSSSTQRPSPLLSTKCIPQFSLANRILDVLYPDLIIDLTHPNGTSCSNFKCQKSLNFHEIISNFTSNMHQYTVNCPYCNGEFVPRFTVHSSLPTWEGSEGIGTLLWCELLSPWTLQKEILNIIESHGIASIISSSFRDPSSSLTSQYCIIFWNLIVYFRHYGLPYAFLITNKLNLALLIL